MRRQARVMLYQKSLLRMRHYEKTHWVADHIKVTKPTLKHQFEIDALNPDKLFILIS